MEAWHFPRKLQPACRERYLSTWLAAEFRESNEVALSKDLAAKRRITPQAGEDVFFASRAIDRFAIHSGGLSFSHLNGRNDFLMEFPNAIPGTSVTMRHAHGGEAAAMPSVNP